MTLTYTFNIAGFFFSLNLPKSQDIDVLLPTFRRFRCDGIESNSILFRFDVVAVGVAETESVEVIGESVNDLGFTRLLKTCDGYKVLLRFTERGITHPMIADKHFTECKAVIDWSDPYAGMALSSLLRIAYSQAVVWHKAVSVHASAVMLGGKGFLFMGKSGTGKSTHSALWQRSFEGCELLNDDNPTIRIVDGEPRVYGTAWSGKTPCYRNEGVPIGGIVRLRQAPVNKYVSQDEVQGFMALLPGCSVISKDKEQYDTLCGTLIEISEKTEIGILDCLPDSSAAELCRKSLSSIK